MSAIKSHLNIDALVKAIGDQGTRKYPPVNQWNPDHVGRIDIRIAADGMWFHEGDPIRRDALVKLFSTVLRHDEDGKHYLVTPVERLEIDVEIAPLFVTEMFVENPGPEQRIVFRTSTEDVADLDADHPLSVSVDAETGEPTPLLLIRDRLQGLLARSVFYDLVDIAEEREIDGAEVSGVMSCGQFHVIGRTDGQPTDAAP